MAKLPNLSSLTLDQIRRLKSDLAKAETKQNNAQKARLVTQLSNQIKNSGFTVEEIAKALLQKKPRGAPARKRAETKRRSVNQAYVDPNDPNNSWTFKGRAPKWVETQMKAAGLDVKDREHKEKFRKTLKKV